MRGAAASLVLVSVTAVATLAANYPDGRAPSEDAGVFFYAARLLLDGGLPYRDVWDHKPPLVYLVDAAGLALAGPAGVWLLQIAALVAAAAVGLRAMARAFGLPAATAGTLAWLLAAPRLFLYDGLQTTYIELYALPVQVAAFAVAARAPDGALSRRDAFGLGALGAVAFLLKPTLVGTWVAIAIVTLARRGRAAIAPLAAMALAAGALVAAVAAYFQARGALGDLLDQAFAYNSAYASFLSPLDRVDAIPQGLRLVTPSGLAVVAVAAWVMAVATRRRAPALLVLAAVALPVELLLATSGRAYHYYFLAWLPAMGILAAFAASELLARLPGPRSRWLLAAAVVVMSIQPARLVTRLAAEHDDGTSRAAAAYVAQRTAPGDAVLVWGSHTEVLVLAGRRSPTRFVYQYAPLATRGYATDARVADLLADLAADPPALILDTSISSFVTPPLDPDGLRTFVSPEPQYVWPGSAERILAFVSERYVRDRIVPGTPWMVWRRR